MRTYRQPKVVYTGCAGRALSEGAQAAGLPFRNADGVMKECKENHYVSVSLIH